MTGGVQVPGGIERVPGVPGIADPAALARWMAGAGLDDLGELRGVQLISGGRSNLTYRLDLAGGTIVLRRPPLGHVLPTAHDMSREYRVIASSRIRIEGSTRLAAPSAAGWPPRLTGQRASPAPSATP